VVEMITSAIPMPISVHTETHAARFPSSKAFNFLLLTKKYTVIIRF
jgi:hypothetical protein